MLLDPGLARATCTRRSFLVNTEKHVCSYKLFHFRTLTRVEKKKYEKASVSVAPVMCNHSLRTAEHRQIGLHRLDCET